MNKIYILLTIPFIFACGLPQYVPTQAIAPERVYPSSPPTFLATETPIPSATVDYQATLNVAQSTADEARRLNAMVTAEYQQRAQEQLQMTAESDRRNQEIYSWTVTAALTAFPATQTQQTIRNTQIAQEAALQSAVLTSTKEAPTQMFVMQTTQQQIANSKVDHAVRTFASIAFSLAALGLVIFALFFPWHKYIKPVVVEDSEPEPVQEVTRINVYKNNGAHSEYHEIPCTPAQFTELAEAITGDLRKFEINRWQREGVYLKDGIKRVRAWARDSKLVIQMADNQLAPKEELIDLLNEWLRSKTLPTGYEFEQTEMEEVDQVGEGSLAFDGLTLIHSPANGATS